MRYLLRAAAIAAVLSLLAAAHAADFRFVLLGDRTGEPQAGIYEQVWRQIAREHPAFVVSAGDTIQGLNDSTAAREWQEILAELRPYRRIPLYLTPGNHDVWSALSAQLFRQYARHPLHYSFDYAQAHFTILDNSRSREMPAAELAYLENDLTQHAAQPLKFIVSHRPSWLLNAGLGNPDFPLHRLAKRFHVQYIVAGHVHQMIHIELNGVTYISLASAGGHLRLSGRYEDGWFFGHTLVEVKDNNVRFEIVDTTGRATTLSDWGTVGLVPAIVGK
ncbi:MAG TPA: metallophosphoesterase [Bryobacteraceae bacterium]|nr:metallophosphoesterase [Bryobacteraceae bacterium]